MAKYKHIHALDANPPAVKRQSLTLVYRNRGVFWLPSYVTVRLVHATYPNDAALNYAQLVGTNLRMLRSRFDELVADGRLVPTDATARIIGRVKPSTKAEIRDSESEEVTMMDLLLAA
jgi:hypothetical protein